ncbi:MAG: ribonuclease P protein component [Planctomycetaceae bacterium]|jgi:uroporphyrinogen III methyltransferase/synthase|nr:ribonuclease P protein component [Planctomycetaceae bacterium]
MKNALALPKQNRLRKTADFQKVYAARNTASDDVLICFALQNDSGINRLGLSVSRKAGNAVVRNRWKRLIREGFRKTQNTISGGFDFVILPQRNTGVPSAGTIKVSVTKLMRKNAGRILPPQRTVLITRPIRQSGRIQTDPLQTELTSLGFRVLRHPIINILPPESWAETDLTVQQILQGQFDWIIFSSANGVHSFFDRAGKRIPAGGLRIAVTGSGTDAALFERLGRHADIVPQTFAAEFAAADLLREAGNGKRFLHLRADRGRDILYQKLTEAGGSVKEISVYRSTDRKESDPQIVDLFRHGKIDFVTVTSPAAAKALVNLFGQWLRRTCLVSISPLTSQVLRELNFPPALEAAEASMQGIAAVLAGVLPDGRI